MPTQRELERELVKKAVQRGMQPDQIKEAVIQFRQARGVTSAPKTEEKKPGFIESVKSAFTKRQGQIEEAADLYGGKKQSLAESALQTAGAATGLLGDIAFEGARAITPEPVKKVLSGAVQKVASAPVVQQGVQAAQQFAEQNPRAARNISAGFNVLSTLPAVKGVQMGATGVKTGAMATASAVKTGAKAAAEKIASTGPAKFVSNVGSAGMSFVKGTGRFLGTVPKRLETAASLSKNEAMERAALSPAARQAAKVGVKPRHARLVDSASPDEKEVFRSMLNQAKTFEVDRSVASPADIAGQQLQRRIAEADALRESVGQQLGSVVKGLPGKEVAARLSVLKRLQEVPGLKGLKITNKGGLDFSNTTLSSNLTKSDRAIIEEAFDAVKGKDASGYHMLRQEIFEVTGGRKKAQVPLTDTQDRALEAIRQGLADSLERVSPKYKAINRRYARIAEPLKNLRKSFSGLEDASSDILDEVSAKLMRRLTSESLGGSKLKNAISKLDEILSAEGQKSSVSLQKLQDFSNALDEYFDIVKDKSFAGQTELGVNKGLREAIGGFVQEKVLQSQEVRKRALEELLFAAQ